MQTKDHESYIEMSVGEQGHIEIPETLRSQFGIVAGTRIRLLVDGNPPRIVLVPVTREYIHAFRGILKHTPEGEALQRRRKEETYRGRQQKKGVPRGSRHRSR